MGDNGKIEESKSKEQLAQERLERYQKDPNSFTENFDLIVAVKKTPEGLMHMINGESEELEICFARLSRKILNILNNREIRANLNKDIKLANPKHGIFNFAKRMK